MAKPMTKIRTVNDMHSTVEEIKLYFFYHNITVTCKAYSNATFRAFLQL